MPECRLILTLALLSAGPLAACSSAPAHERVGPAPRVRPETIAAAVEKVPRTLTYVASIVAAHDAVLSSPTGGRVESYAFDRGDAFQRGALLVKLRDSELVAATQAAEASAAQAEARLGGARDPAQLPEVLAAKSALDVAADAARRAERLHQHGSTSEQDLLRARANEASAKANYEAALAQGKTALGLVRQMRANERQANAALGDKSVRGPFDGIVLDRFVEVGQVAAPGAPILRVIDPSGLRARFEVPQSEAHHASIGRTVFAGGLRGKIDRVTPGLVGDAHLRTVEAVLEVPGPDGGAVQAPLPGSRTPLRLELPESDDAVVVPARATRSTAGIVRVWVVRERKLEERLVEVLRFEKDSVFLKSGIAAGEAIVTAPLDDFRDGQEVSQ